MNTIHSLLADVLNETADLLEAGGSRPAVRIGITLLGSEHGSDEILRGAELAARRNPLVSVHLIGPAAITTRLPKHIAETEEDCHKKMDELLASGELDGAVTLHYNFPVGTATVGLVDTPARGRPMFIASTTGTTAAARVEAMIKNTLCGIAAAKAYGIEAPTVGILNVDGARQVERLLRGLAANGYPLQFADSQRADGGAVMRGNDLLLGTPDVMVCDSLTGNLLMKLFSAYSSGGDYETSGCGYGPALGASFPSLVHIISRSSGAPVIANAIDYAGKMAAGHVLELTKTEFATAEQAGLANRLAAMAQPPPAAAPMPTKKIVDRQISGIDVLSLDDAQQLLWRNDIYAETGMGCTGPILLVAVEDLTLAQKLLKTDKLID